MKRFPCSVVLGFLFFSALGYAQDTYHFVLKWGSNGTGDGQFNKPFGLAVDSVGKIYVPDHLNHRIQIFDANGVFITKWGSYGNGDGQFNGPSSVAVDPNGNVYVADFYNLRIQKFDSALNFVTKWGIPGTPFYVAVDLEGYVYVTERFGPFQIKKFDSNGAFITSWGGEGAGDGKFDVPAGLAVDSYGYVYVADHYHHRIQKFDSNGVFIMKWGSYGGGNGQFIIPCSVAVDPYGYVYVSEYGNCRIQKFDPNGNFITKWGSPGVGDGQMYFPYGIAIDPDGYAYVADTENHRIQKFERPLIYNFEGFLSPIENNPTINTAKAGQAIPIKWRLTDKNGLPVSDPTSFLSIKSVIVNCGAFLGDPTSLVDEPTAGSSSGLQYLDDGWWQYNWKTSKTYSGQCRILKLALNDYSAYTARFNFY